VLKGGTGIAAERDAFTVTRTLPHGHVAAALGTARKISLDRILGPDGDRCRDLVLALARPQRDACFRVFCWDGVLYLGESAEMVGARLLQGSACLCRGYMVF
jgi:hypothetical protein